MPATPLRSHAFTPEPNSSELGIMPDLYRLSVGPVNAAYYQKHFQRFETLGKAVPTWNNGAAFFTLAWLLLRKLWRPAAIYAALLTALLLLWSLGIHGKVPIPVEVSICLIAGLLLCILPGFLGNALYYQHVRNQTLKTLSSASSLAQARVILTNEATTKERFQVTASVQGLASLAIAATIYANIDMGSAAPAVTLASGPPDIVIPSVESLRAKELKPFTPDMALPSADDPELDFQPMTVPLTTATNEPVTQQKKEPDLSIVEFAQAVPAAGAAAGAASMAAPRDASTPAAKTPGPAANVPLSAPSTKEKEVPAASAVAAKNLPSKTSERTDPNRLIPGKFYLNAGVYAQAANVNSAIKRLQSAKLQTVRQTIHSNKGELTRLRIGPFDTQKQAEQAAAKAKQLRIQTQVFQHPK